MFKLRVYLQRQYFRFFPKKEITKEEMCNAFCSLPDNIKIYINGDNAYEGQLITELNFVNSKITIKENGN